MTSPSQNKFYEDNIGTSLENVRKSRSREPNYPHTGDHHHRENNGSSRSRNRNLSPHSKQRRRRSEQEELRLQLLKREAGTFVFVSDLFSNWLHVSDTSLHQQRLHGYDPIYHFKPVGELLIKVGIVVVLIGAFFIVFGKPAKDFKIAYGDKCSAENNYLRLLRIACPICRGGHSPSCDVQWQLHENLKTPVYVYYELENIIQNHRALVSSYDQTQFQGSIYNPETRQPVEPARSCAPLQKDNKKSLTYFPCGAMANMMFSDDFSMKTAKSVPIQLRKQGISHFALKHYKYKNPEGVNKKNYNINRRFIDNFVKPKDWSKEVWDVWWKNGGMQNEAFINWMVISAKSTSRKLYAVIDEVPGCRPGVFCKGNYSIHVNYRFDAQGFEAKKSLVFSTITSTGSRNRFIGWYSVFIGSIQTLIGCYFLKLAKNRWKIMQNQAIAASSGILPPPPSRPPSTVTRDDDDEKEAEIEVLYPNHKDNDYDSNKSKKSQSTEPVESLSSTIEIKPNDVINENRSRRSNSDESHGSAPRRKVEKNIPSPIPAGPPKKRVIFENHRPPGENSTPDLSKGKQIKRKKTQKVEVKDQRQRPVAATASSSE